MATQASGAAAKEAVKQAAENPWVHRFTRLGLAVRGIIFATVGLLALEVALGRGGKFTDQQGAIATIGSEPFGKVLLIVMAVGLAGYSLWGLIRALADPYHRGSDTKGLLTRAGYLVSGVAYALLLMATLRYLGQPGAGAGGSSTQRLAASVLTRPWGPWAVALVGLIGIVGGLAQVVQGWRADFDDRFKSYALSPGQRRWVIRLGRFGTIARGLVFSLIGFLLLRAAWLHNVYQAKGLDGALQALAQNRYGPWLLGLAALGLVAFGAYSLLGALWFRLKA